jgi:hypothetical protein
MEKVSLGPLCSILGTLSFIAFGILACVNLRAPFDPVIYIVAGVVGIFFSMLYKKIISFLLKLLNSDVKKEIGSDSIKKVVHRSGIFMLPFALMFFLASYFLGWTGAAVFFSSAAMNTGVLASTEFAKLKGKTAVKNTIAVSATSTVVSYLWMFSSNYLKNVPMLIKAGIGFVLPLLGVK